MTNLLADRIAQRCKECGLSPIRLANLLGENRDAVRDIVRGKSKNPSAGLLFGIARVLKTTPGYLLGITDNLAQDAMPHTSHGAALQKSQNTYFVNEPVKLALTDVIALYEPMHNGAYTALVIGGTPNGYLPRPPGLANVRSAFAMRVADETMAPKYDAGMIVYVAAGHTLRSGQGCVIETPVGTFLRRYARTQGHIVFVEQLNPWLEVKFEVSEVVAVHAVLGTWDG